MGENDTERSERIQKERDKHVKEFGRTINPDFDKIKERTAENSGLGKGKRVSTPPPDVKKK